MSKRLHKAALLALCIMPTLTFASHWSYEGKDSPEHWSQLSDEYKTCQQGMNQSPININETLKAHINPLKSSYIDSPVSIINNGHTIQANFATDAKDIVAIDGVAFRLQQLHFHTPSENTINGKHFAMEMHMVHKNEDGDIAVVAVMFDKGAANPELEKLWQEMPAKADDTEKLKVKINVAKLLPDDLSHYRFSGSLTTPPCSEGVRWLVMKHPLTLSEAQLDKFMKTMHHDNNRPVQPLHGRVVVE